MKSGTALLFLLTSALGKRDAADEPRIWALLVAGSNGYYNYRHQADVCHAYQILHRHGIPDENIVVMMFDDIAQNEENPTKGVIVNHPMGPDVYKGVPKDYIGKDVTPENFLKILQGDAKAMQGIGSGKVIASGPNDHVFVNFVDHGAPGLVAFPSGELTAKELLDAVQAMSRKRQYAKMVIYVEACESGSMFRGLLPEDINEGKPDAVFATTAANATQSSYACYFDEKRMTYLGDWYSVHWMEDSDKENLRTETLLRQFKLTRSETNTSHVEQFGDPAMGRLPVAEFQGERPSEPIRYPTPPWQASPNCYDVPLDILFKRHSYARHHHERQRHHNAILETLKKRDYVEQVFKAIARALAPAAKKSAKEIMTKGNDFAIKDWDRYTELVHFFSRTCFNLGQNPYALSQMHVVVHLSNSPVPLESIKEEMGRICAGVTPVPGGIH